MLDSRRLIVGLLLAVPGIWSAGCSSAPADGQPVSGSSGEANSVRQGDSVAPDRIDVDSTIDNPVASNLGPAAARASASSAGSVSVQPVDFDGYRAVVAKHRGKVVVVDLWATWCIPCVQNFPHLVEMHEKFLARGVACVSLSLDNLGDDETAVEKKLPAVRKFLTQQGATFDNLISVLPFDEMAAADKLGVGQIPAVFVFNQRGEQVRVFVPGPDLLPAKMYEEVESIVVQLLRGNDEK